MNPDFTTVILDVYSKYNSKKKRDFQEHFMIWCKKVVSFVVNHKTEELIDYIKDKKYLSEVRKKDEVTYFENDFYILERIQNNLEEVYHTVRYIAYSSGFSKGNNHKLAEVLAAIMIFYDKNIGVPVKNEPLYVHEVIINLLKNKLFSNNDSRYINTLYGIEGVEDKSLIVSDKFIRDLRSFDVKAENGNVIIYNNKCYLTIKSKNSYPIFYEIPEEMALDVISYKYVPRSKFIDFYYFIECCKFNHELAKTLPVEFFGYNEWDMILEECPKLAGRLREAHLTVKDWLKLKRKYPFVVSYIPVNEFRIKDWKVLFS